MRNHFSDTSSLLLHKVSMRDHFSLIPRRYCYTRYQWGITFLWYLVVTVTQGINEGSLFWYHVVTIAEGINEGSLFWYLVVTITEGINEESLFWYLVVTIAEGINEESLFFDTSSLLLHKVSMRDHFSLIPRRYCYTRYQWGITFLWYLVVTITEGINEESLFWYLVVTVTQGINEGSLFWYHVVTIAEGVVSTLNSFLLRPARLVRQY
jgi:hypothetical protein